MISSGIVQKIIIVSEYPDRWNTDTIRYYVTCEYSYDRLGHPKYCFTLVGNDDLQGFIELLDAMEMTKDIQVKKQTNGYNFYKGVFGSTL